MRNYSNQFSQLLELIAEALDISESHYQQAKQRYESIGRWLERDESKVAGYSPETYPQGSFALGTVTKPIFDTEEYDLDFVSQLNLKKDEITQEGLKNLVGYEVRSYAHANNMNSPAKEGRRCWTLSYADGAQFHMDILPAIPDVESFKLLLELRGHPPSTWTDFAIAITDNTLPRYAHIDPDWPRSNPKGYAAWFRSRMETEFSARRDFLAKSMQARVEDVPEYKVKTPLQRAIQILKRHRDIMFVSDPENKPISIIITTLAGHAYNNESDLLDALRNLVEGMTEHIRSDNGVIWIPNPVNPLENFADKWRGHPQRKENFYRWLQQVQQDLDKALKLGNIPGIGELLKQPLGERVINEALRNLSEANRNYVPTLTAINHRNPSRFDVVHRQAPKWLVTPKGSVRIMGRAYRKGFRPYEIKSDSTPLPKQLSLQFEAQTDVPRPYKIYWQVVNTGNEAHTVRQLRGGFYDGIFEKGRQIRKESTRYKGMHWIECFIIKDGTCWARSGEYVVNIT